MLEKFEKLPLRSGVGIVVLNKNNKVFVAKRIDNPKNFWQMPQGGIDEGENNLDAALRELEEETSIRSVKLLKEIDGYTTYLLPDNLLGIIWKGKFKGQKQKWFIVKFMGEDSEINIKTKHPEFLDWQWIDYKKITETVVDFKLHVYQQIQKEIEKVVNWYLKILILRLYDLVKIFSGHLSFLYSFHFQLQLYSLNKFFVTIFNIKNKSC